MLHVVALEQTLGYGVGGTGCSYLAEVVLGVF